MEKSRSSHEGRRTVPPVVKTLLFLNIGIYFYQMFSGQKWQVTQLFALWPVHEGPPAVGFEFWQLLTYGFLHGNNLHLFTNMFGLWMFGSMVEKAWGARLFTQFFLICVVGAGLVQLAVTSFAAQSGEIYPTVGASGGLFGVLLAFALLYPNVPLMLLFVPIPIKAKYFILGYAVVELGLGVFNTDSGVAHFAHLGGMAFGFLVIRYWIARGILFSHRTSPPVA